MPIIYWGYYRSRTGDWEVDTVIGQQGGAVVVTVTERKTRLTLLAWSKNKTAREVKNSLVTVLLPMVTKVKILTFDNGKEFAFHTQISEQLQAKSYFAHPYHSWERGLNENTNGLLRQYAPKSSNFDKLTQRDIDYMMNQLNNRPRKCLGYKMPNEVMFGTQSSIGTSELNPPCDQRITFSRLCYRNTIVPFSPNQIQLVQVYRYRREDFLPLTHSKPYASLLQKHLYYILSQR